MAEPVIEYGGIRVEKVLDNWLPMSSQIRLDQIANRVSPHEACGFILKNGTVIQLPNDATQKRSGFAFNPLHQLNIMTRHKGRILGIWHTHPGGIAIPSQKDVEGWPYNLSWRYFIVTKHEITEWRKVSSDIALRVGRAG